MPGAIVDSNWWLMVAGWIECNRITMKIVDFCGQREGISDRLSWRLMYRLKDVFVLWLLLVSCWCLLCFEIVLLALLVQQYRITFLTSTNPCGLLCEDVYLALAILCVSLDPFRRWWGILLAATDEKLIYGWAICRTCNLLICMDSQKACSIAWRESWCMD